MNRRTSERNVDRAAAMLIAGAVLAAGLGAFLPAGRACAADNSQATAAASTKPSTRPVAELIGQLPKLDFGDGEDVLGGIVQQVIDARKEQYPALEQQLIKVALDGNAKLAARQFACRMLRIVGSGKSVPPMSQLLGDEKLSHMARQVLLGLPDGSVNEALRNALNKASAGNLRIGVINVLADRGDWGAVVPLGKLAKDPDQATAAAAIRAIGRIGSPEAMDFLRQFKPAEPLLEAWYDARLTSAERMYWRKKVDEARMAFNELYEPAMPAKVRGAALNGLARIDHAGVLPQILEAFRSDAAPLRQGAAMAVLEVREPGTSEQLAQALPGMPPASRAVMIGALAGRSQRDGGITAAVNKLVSDPDSAVQTQAILGLRRLGDASSVEPLAAVLRNPAQKDLNNDALTTLKQMFAGNVAEEVMKRAEGGEIEVRAAMFGVLADRREQKALPLALKCSSDGEKNVRVAAMKAVGALGGAAERDAFVARILKGADGGELDALDQAVSAISKRVDGSDEVVIKALAGASDQAQVHLLNVLMTLGGNKSLAAVRGALKSPSLEVKKAAVRGLGDWPDPAPINDVKALAKDDADEAVRILALRGFIRQVGLKKDRPAKEAMGLYQEAWDLAKRPQEKTQVLGGVSNVKDLAALQFVEKAFEDKALQKDAFNAAIKLAEPVGKNRAPEVKATLEKVINLTQDEEIKRRAKAEIDKLPK